MKKTTLSALVMSIGLCIYSCNNQTEEIKTISPENAALKKRRLDSLIDFGIALEKSGIAPNYEELYGKALKIDSTNQLTRIFYSHALIQKKDYNGALKILNNVLASEPGNSEALFAKGLTFLHIQPDSGFYYCEKSVAAEPGNIQNLVDLAAIYADNDKYAKAFNLIKKAKEGDPKSEFLVFLGGIYRTKMGDYAQGLKDMEVIPKNRINDGACYFNRALAYFGLERYSECKKEMDKAIKCDSTVANFWWLRANVETRLKMYEEAIHDAKKAGDLGYKEGYILSSRLEGYLKKKSKNK